MQSRANRNVFRSRLNCPVSTSGWRNSAGKLFHSRGPSSSSRSPDGPLRCSVTPSNLRSPYCRQQFSISVLDVVEPRAAWATRGPRPGGWWLLALMTVDHQLKGSIRRHTWVQAGNVTEQGWRRWSRMSLMSRRPDLWSTSALEICCHHWMSSICRWHFIWNASSVFTSADRSVHVSAL